MKKYETSLMVTTAGTMHFAPVVGADSRKDGNMSEWRKNIGFWIRPVNLARVVYRINPTIGFAM